MSETKPEGLTTAEWNVILYEASTAARPLIVRAGAAAGVWELPRDKSTCPVCGTPKGESA